MDTDHAQSAIINKQERTMFIIIMTVKEAEDAGFRRAFKWFGNDWLQQKNALLTRAYELLDEDK